MHIPWDIHIPQANEGGSSGSSQRILLTVVSMHAFVPARPSEDESLDS